MSSLDCSWLFSEDGVFEKEKGEKKKKEFYFWFLTIISSLGSYFTEGEAGWSGGPARAPQMSHPWLHRAFSFQLKAEDLGLS